MDLSWSTSARGKQASDHAPPPKMWNPITGTPRDPGPLGPRKAGMAPAYEHYQEQQHQQHQESQRGAASQQEPMEPNAPQQPMSSSRYDNQAEQQPGGGGQSFAPAQVYDGSARGQVGGSRGRDDQQHAVGPSSYTQAEPPREKHHGPQQSSGRRNYGGSYEQGGGGGGHPSLPAQYQSQSHPFSTRNSGGSVAGASHASGVKPLNLTGLREPGVSSGGAPVRGDDGRTKSSYRAQNPGSAGGTPAGGPLLAADTAAGAAAAPMSKEHPSHPQPPEQYITARPAGAYKSSVGNTRASGRVESGRGPIAHVADGGGAAAGVDSRSRNSSSVLRHRARKTQSPTGKIGGAGVNSTGSTPSAAAINEQPTFVRKPPGGASSICFG